MGKGRIRVLAAIPGSTSLGPILRSFDSRQGGIVTALSDSYLPECRRLVGEVSQLEVVSFSELVRTVLIQCGEDVLPATQGGHKQAAIAFACRQLPDASPFNGCVNFAGFHEALEQTIDELHMWGIDADEMSDLASLATPRLAAKLADMAEIDRSVAAVLERLGRQLHSYQLQASLSSTLEWDGDTNRLLVFADAEECPLRFIWLKWLASQGFDIQVVFDRHATGAPIFQGATRSLELLGVEAESIGYGNRLARNLFVEPVHDGTGLEVSIMSASDPLAEVEWTLRGCLDALAEGERAAIYVRDLESYAPLINSVSKRFDLPVHMARRAPLMTNSFARLTLSALKFCASEDVRSLSSILKSSYLGLPGLTQNLLDGMLRDCYRTKKAQWSELETWSTGHQAEYPWLDVLMKWRQRFLQESRPLSDWSDELQEFMRDQALPWVNFKQKVDDGNDRDLWASNQMGRLLANRASIDKVTDKTRLSLAGFAEFCERIWTDGDVSIPTDEDGLLVTSEPNAVGEVDRLFVLGMLEGIFPRRRSEDPILTDGERAEINALRRDQPPLQDSYFKARAERDIFYRVCAIPRTQIVFSYPLTDDQRDNIPAFYLHEVRQAMGGESAVGTTDHPRPQLAPAIDRCLADADRRLRQAFEGPRQMTLPLEIVAPSVRAAIKPADGKGFSPYVLRDALQCPFQYLVRHVLKLRVKRQSERWGSLYQLPQSVQLLDKADLADAELALIGALDAELESLYAEVPDWEMQLLKSGGQRLIRDWLQREEWSRKNWTKDSGSMKANVRFGDHGTRDEMPGRVKLEGYLAGRSKLEGYNVAHLYGFAASDPKDLTDTEKLYVGLHLLAVHEQGRESAVEVETASGKRTLLVLGRGASRPLPSRVEEGLQVVDLTAVDDFGSGKKEFYNDVKKVLSEAVSRIVNGRVDATPGGQCDRCDYGELCRRSSQYGEHESLFDDYPEDPDV